MHRNNAFIEGKKGSEYKTLKMWYYSLINKELGLCECKISSQIILAAIPRG